MSTITRIPAGVVEKRRNVFLNPWAIYPPGPITLNGDLTASAAAASSILRITHTAGATAGGEYIVHPMRGFVVGVTYGIRIFLESITGPVSVVATLRNGIGNSLMQLTQTPGSGFIILTGTYTVTAPVADPLVVIDVLGPGTGEAFNLWGSICEPGVTAPGPYFDGATLDTPVNRYDWIGTAYASESIMSVPSPADQITPLLVLAPHAVEQEARTRTRSLLESSATRTVYIPPAARANTMQLLFDTADKAYAALAFFGTNHDYWLDEPELPAVGQKFSVSGGNLVLTQDDTAIVPWVLDVPWVAVP